MGVGSGLDLEELITGIVSAERTPAKNRLDQQEAQTTATISALGSLKASLADFQSALGKLGEGDPFNGRRASSSHSELFTASADRHAVPGDYDIEVVQLASSHRLASGGHASADSTVGQGLLTLGSGEKSFQVAIQAGVNDSLAGIRDAINQASDNPGVRASLMTVAGDEGETVTRLVLTAERSGSEGALRIDVDGDAGLQQLAWRADDPTLDPNHPDHDPNRMQATQPARDALITIDGFAVTSSSNRFEDAIDGISLTVHKAGEEEIGQLRIEEDQRGARKAVEEFVASYNALMGITGKLTRSDPEQNERALLSGDSSIRLIESRLRGILGSTVEGAPADFNSLAFLGLSTERDGSLKLDPDQLDRALASRPQDVAALFSGDQGVAARMDAAIGDLLSRDGLFAHRESSLQNQLSRIDQQREALALRLEKIEQRYRSQFSALDILVGQLNQTGNFLMQQLEATAQLVTPKK